MSTPEDWAFTQGQTADMPSTVETPLFKVDATMRPWWGSTRADRDMQISATTYKALAPRQE